MADPLVDALNPDRDYGDLSFEQVVDQITRGEITITPGKYGTLPILRSTTTSRVVKGSGRATRPNRTPKELGELRKHQYTREGRDWLDACMEGNHDFSEGETPRDRLMVAVFTMIESTRHPSPGAAMGLMTQYVGKAQETRSSKGLVAIEAVMENLGKGTTATVRTLEIEGEARDVE